MTHTIHCEIDRADGSLLRLIGLIERRGFDVASLDMETSAGAHGASHRRIAVGVMPRDDGRDVQVLGRQIDRLYGVRRVDADVISFPAECAR